jgi:hypothetical protein
MFRNIAKRFKRPATESALPAPIETAPGSYPRFSNPSGRVGPSPRTDGPTIPPPPQFPPLMSTEVQRFPEKAENPPPSVPAEIASTSEVSVDVQPCPEKVEKPPVVSEEIATKAEMSSAEVGSSAIEAELAPLVSAETVSTTELSVEVQCSTEKVEKRSSMSVEVIGAGSMTDFSFIVNGVVFESDVVEAISLWPPVSEQLSVDACARRFVINDSRIEDPGLSSLSEILSVAGSPRRIELNCETLSRFSIDELDGLLCSNSKSIESEDSLLYSLLSLGGDYDCLVHRVRFEFVSSECLINAVTRFDLGFPPEPLWHFVIDRELIISSLPAPTVDSVIISEFPHLFNRFRLKQFRLLWRWSRDNRDLSRFHQECDGHAPTLTLIEDTDDNIFGGYTPIPWSSPPRGSCCLKSDYSMQTCLFTLKNPHNISPMMFSLNPAWMERAIECSTAHGPDFNSMSVRYDGAQGTWLSTRIYPVYLNDTGIDEDTILAGAGCHRPEEIEVFEVTG